MKTIPVRVHDGVLCLAEGLTIPSTNQLAVLLFEPKDRPEVIQEMAEHGGAFSFLENEPDLYIDADVLPDRKNPDFSSNK
jgi:hypothetical protein